MGVPSPVGPGVMLGVLRGDPPAPGGGCGLIGKSSFTGERAVKRVPELGRVPAPELTAVIVCSSGPVAAVGGLSAAAAI